MERRRVSNINIEGAKIMFKNFEGAESKFNRRGNRNFCVFIEDPAFAAQLIQDGWNIKTMPPREDGDVERYYVQVSVNYDNIPPQIWLISNGQKTLLDENTVECLDYAEIVNVDLTIRPYCWEVNGSRGVKAYAKTMYVTIETDQFAAKYANL